MSTQQESSSLFRVVVIPVTGFQQNCSLVYNAETLHGTVVDPGGDVDVIMAAIEKTGLTIDKILLTHGHIDHAGGAAELREKLGVKIEGPHQADVYMLKDLPQTGARYGMMTARAFESDRLLGDGDVVEVAGFTFDVIHAPGHSPGSVVFFNKADAFALMGDVLFHRSIGRTDLPNGDHETLIRSIKEKILPLGDDVVFLPGHGQASRIGDERENNPFLV